MNLPLVLASSSKSRQMILKKLATPFTVMSPDIDETVWPDEAPEAHVLRLAQAKAKKAASILHDSDSDSNSQGALIIGCDSVCVLAGKIMSKPESHAAAIAQLQASSGEVIYFYSGLALLNTHTNSLQTTVDKTEVHFKKLSDATIEAYLQKDQPYHCAGSIKAEGLGIILLEKMQADDPNSLIGLPLIKLIEMLNNEGFALL